MKRPTIIILLIILTFSITFGTETLAAINLTNAVQKVGPAAGFENAEPSLAQQVGQVIQGLLSLLGVIFMILIIYGGYLWMIARGNEEQVTKAKAIIRGSIIGLFIVLAAYAISTFITTNLLSATNYTTGAKDL